MKVGGCESQRVLFLLGGALEGLPNDRVAQGCCQVIAVHAQLVHSIAQPSIGDVAQGLVLWAQPPACGKGETGREPTALPVHNNMGGDPKACTYETLPFHK